MSKITNRIKITTTPPKIRWAVFIALALLALAVRLPQLGVRPMHTDESINGYITGQLLEGESYRYDPQDRHGPALYALARPLARLLGARHFSDLTETQLRLTPVIVGSVTVLMFGFATEMFGFTAACLAALLFALAPLTIYYNRYFIHETLFVTATFGLILSGDRALKSNSLWSAALAGLCAALMLACKETAPLHFFAIVIAMIACRYFPGTPAGHASFGKLIFRAAMVFAIVMILLFTWFGQNWSGLTDLIRAIPRFAARAGGEGHEKPFWYYISLLGGGWSGAVLLILAVVGALVALLDFNRNKAASIFILVYGIAITAIYSAIPYKTPWLALNFWLPFTVLAGFAGNWLWQNSKFSPIRWLLVPAAAIIGLLMAHDTWQRVFFKPADGKNPYAYAHTSEDLLRLPIRLAELARHDNRPDPRIAVVAADAWPLPWYLRNYSQVGYWQPGQDPGPADYFITTANVPEQLNDRLKQFRPEFFGVRPDVLLILWTPEPSEPRP